LAAAKAATSDSGTLSAAATTDTGAVWYLRSPRSGGGRGRVRGGQRKGERGGANESAPARR
jgi:hypothetical protein